MTWHVAVPRVPPADSGQLPDGEKVPVPVVVKDTDPVGVVAPDAAVSITVAVQIVAELTLTDAGAHAIAVDVGSTVGATMCTVRVTVLGVGRPAVVARAKTEKVAPTPAAELIKT